MTDTQNYYDQSYPPSLWGGGAVPAASATAGLPGSWLPAGSTPPATVAALQGSSITAVPATPWVNLQYVQTGTAGAPGEATWTGTGWVGGRSPAVEFDPGAHTIAEVEAYIEGLDEDDVVAEVDRVTDAEIAGKNRTTLVAWLDDRTVEDE